MKLDLDELERLVGYSFTDEWKAVGLAVLAEVRAAREWLAATNMLHTDMEDLFTESDIDLSAVEESAFRAYSALVAAHEAIELKEGKG